MSEPTTGGATTGGAASAGNATLILVFGILGILCCPILAPVAWYMGSQELQGIAAGSIVATNEGTAKAGKILGIIGTALVVFWLIWMFVFGGLAAVGSLTG